MTSRTTPIKEIRDGQSVEGRYLVKEMNRSETKAGKPYLMLTVMDATGELAGRIWENAEQLAAECPTGAVIRLTGKAESYKGVMQLRIDTAQRVDPATVDPAEFLPTTPGDIKAMTRELKAIADGVENPFLRELLLGFLEDRKFMAAFKAAPAAKAMHHAYVGGLLEHTLAIARLANQVCALYPALDRSLLLAGVLLHDIGKIKEFDTAKIPADYSDAGRLVGHMVLGIGMIDERIGTIKGFPAELAARLKHLVLSHHGSHEFGSPVLPMMIEAFVLHFLDNLDAKIAYFDRLGSQAQGEGYQWSDYQRNLERFLYLRPAAPQGPTTPSNAPEIDPRQRNLFDLG
ncbi:MAG TPA: HD domain-containing protein [Desulfurivibrionaceae bacterium]|nr:HD domain-containing protein [Desulfurivibrionaceae bacterium]